MTTLRLAIVGAGPAGIYAADLAKKSERGVDVFLAGIAGRSFTEGQAKSRLEANGYSNVGALKKDDNGIWKGTATHSGAQVVEAPAIRSCSHRSRPSTQAMGPPVRL